MNNLFGYRVAERGFPFMQEDSPELAARSLNKWIYSIKLWLWACIWFKFSKKKYSAITLLIRTGNTAAGFRYNLLSLGLLTFDREKINWILLSHRKTLCVFWVLKLNLHWSWLLQVKRVQLSSQFFFLLKIGTLSRL